MRVVRLSQLQPVRADTLPHMSPSVRPRRAQTDTDFAAESKDRVLASDPRALSDAAAFALLVLALAGVLALIGLIVVGALHFA